MISGIDSGGHAGFSLIERVSGGFLLKHLWYAASSKPDLWMKKVVLICTEIFTEATESKDKIFRIYVEQPPITMRKDSLDGDRRGHTTWLGMGRNLGRIEAVWFSTAGYLPIPLEHREWVSRMPAFVLRKKIGDGTHRIHEAGRIVRGAAEGLAEIPLSYRVDCAESILVAVAGATVPLS